MFESHHVSRHYEKRRQQSLRKGNGRHAPAVNRARSRVVRHLPKLSLAVHAASHLILAASASTGSGSDSPYFVPLMLEASRRMSLEFALADAGYDSEDNHRLARQELGIRSLIPATIGRQSAKGPMGYYRRLMRQPTHQIKLDATLGPVSSLTNSSIAVLSPRFRTGDGFGKC